MRYLTMFLALTISTASLSAAESSVRARWSQLDGLILGKKVRFLLPDGEKIKARVLSVGESEITADVLSTSNKKKHPRGETVIPHESVAEVMVLERGGKWTTIGGVAGTVGGLFLGALVAFTGPEEAFFPIWIGSATGGVMLGRAADRKDQRVVVVPD